MSSVTRKNYLDFIVTYRGIFQDFCTILDDLCEEPELSAYAQAGNNPNEAMFMATKDPEALETLSDGQVRLTVTTVKKIKQLMESRQLFLANADRNLAAINEILFTKESIWDLDFLRTTPAEALEKVRPAMVTEAIRRFDLLKQMNIDLKRFDPRINRHKELAEVPTAPAEAAEDTGTGIDKFFGWLKGHDIEPATFFMIIILGLFALIMMGRR